MGEEEYESWIAAEEKQRRIITLLGRKLTARQVSQVCSVIYYNNMNIDSIMRLSERISLKQPDANAIASIQMSVSGPHTGSVKMREELMGISKKSGIDISFQTDDIYRKNRKLVVFDMDSTLIQAEVIDELAAMAGVEQEVSGITRLAMNGEIDFEEAFRRRVKLLAGLKEEDIYALPPRLPLTSGAKRVTRVLKLLGYKTGIISGGFTFVGAYLKEKLNIDYVYANELDIRNGAATGETTGEIITGEKKALILKELAEKEDLSLAQTIAVGDGANDLPMISVAGLGVAFNAKPFLKEKADSSISQTFGLDGLLYLLGIRDRDQQAIG